MAKDNGWTARATRILIEDLVVRGAYWSDAVGGLSHRGEPDLSAAFTFLGWENPHPTPHLRCTYRTGCLQRAVREGMCEPHRDISVLRRIMAGGTRAGVSR